MAAAGNELDRELREAGGLDAPPSLSARLRRLLLAELDRGSGELQRTRSGYQVPISVILTPGERQAVALLPAPSELRADPGEVLERTATVVTATVEALVEAASPGPAAGSGDLLLRAGSFESHLALSYPAHDARTATEY